jgi:hypothetical protein
MHFIHGIKQRVDQPTSGRVDKRMKYCARLSFLHKRYENLPGASIMYTKTEGE